MDEFINFLLEAIKFLFEVISENLSARFRGCFVVFALLLFLFWVSFGGLFGYAVAHSLTPGLLIGGIVGSVLGILSIRKLEKRAKRLRSRL